MTSNTSKDRPATSLYPLLHWLPFLLYAALIFAVSHQSQPIGEELVKSVGDWLIHAVEYAIFALLLSWAISSGRPSRLTVGQAILIVVLSSIYGATDELHQAFVPDRVSSINDWTADTAGAVLATGLLIAVRPRLAAVGR